MRMCKVAEDDLKEPDVSKSKEEGSLWYSGDTVNIQGKVKRDNTHR